MEYYEAIIFENRIFLQFSNVIFSKKWYTEPKIWMLYGLLAIELSLFLGTVME